MLKDAIDLSTLRRVLVIKLRHHGDVLLASPVFTVLKNHAPHVEIDALVYKDTAEMLTLHPAISQVHTVDRQWKKAGLGRQAKAEWGLLSALRGRHYDLVIHLTEHNRGAWVKRLTGATYGVTQRQPKHNPFWVNSFSHFFPIPRGRWRHRAELNLDGLRRIGVQPRADERRLMLVPGAAAEESVDQLLAQNGLKGDFIQFHPASRWQFKCWSNSSSTELIKALQAEGHRVVLTAAPDEREIALVKEITAPLEQPVIDLSGQLSLKQLAALTARAKLFVGFDSAPMHIAAAVQTPTVVLFGPTSELEWGPWMVPNRVLVSDHICRPCGIDGCGGGKRSECLDTIGVDRVLAAAHELLDARAPADGRPSAV